LSHYDLRFTNNKLLTAFTLSISLFFISCANMQMGFDEECLFYHL